MQLTNQRLLITGGAGLVGSELAHQLAGENEVTVVDNLSNGIKDSVPDAVEFTKADLADQSEIEDVVTSDFDAVFHCAVGDKYVNSTTPRKQFEQNIGMTCSLLERMNQVGVTQLMFTSSSTVYGEAPQPITEDHTPLQPISSYGAAKLSEEAILSVYAHSHDFTVWNFRLANVLGPRSGAGVVPDFVEKLSANPEKLSILGDGSQEKSYIHVEQCIDAIQHVVKHSSEEVGPIHTYNLGNRTTTSVNRIADIVSSEMGVNPCYEYTGGDRGWSGDIPKVHLSTAKLEALGWRSPQNSNDSVRRVVRELIT
jgi:UDP-glucose 4-epimerase